MTIKYLFRSTDTFLFPNDRTTKEGVVSIMPTSHDDEYEVEAIIGRRNNGGRVEYLIKWKGYSEEENTWEPDRILMMLRWKRQEH